MFIFNKRGLARVYGIEVSEFSGKVYTPYKGKLSFDFPDKDLIEAIEQKKAEMFYDDTTKWAQEIVRENLLSKRPSDIFEDLLNSGEVNKYIVVKRDQYVADVKELMLKKRIGKSKAYEVKMMIDAYIQDKDIKIIKKP